MALIIRKARGYILNEIAINSNRTVRAPTFIGGSSSSGSTLLRVILDRHPHFFCGHELSIFNKKQFLRNFKKIKKNCDYYLKYGLPTDGYSKYFGLFNHREEYELNHDQLKRWIQGSEDVVDFCDRLFAYCLNKTDKRFFSEKTPSNVYNFLELSKLFPEAKFVFICRDGRDVVCSLRKRKLNWFQASSVWLYNNVCGVKASTLDNFYKIRYEDLVNNPETEIKQLCEFLEIKFYREMVYPERKETSNRTITSWDLYPEQQITNASVGKYKEKLTEEGAAIFQHTHLSKYAAKKLDTDITTVPQLMDELGYTMDQQWDRPSFSTKKYIMEDRLNKTFHFVKRGQIPSRPLTTLDTRKF